MGKRLFIHIPKNGGMTIRRNPDLAQKVLLAGPKHHINYQYTRGLEKKMSETQDHEGYEHAPWRYWREDLRNKHQAVAIVRNPWDRVMSRYFFAKKVIEVEKESNVYGKKDYADTSSFDAFLEERHKWGDVEYMWHRAVRGWYPAYYHVSDEEGNVRCDILRFEEYNQDIKDYFRVLFNPEPRNVTGLNKGSYKDMYTPETIQIVADWYKQDIDYWGFDFDTGATRNYWNA